MERVEFRSKFRDYTRNLTSDQIEKEKNPNKYSTIISILDEIGQIWIKPWGEEAYKAKMEAFKKIPEDSIRLKRKALLESYKSLKKEVPGEIEFNSVYPRDIIEMVFSKLGYLVSGYSTENRKTQLVITETATFFGQNTTKHF